MAVRAKMALHLVKKPHRSRDIVILLIMYQNIVSQVLSVYPRREFSASRVRLFIKPTELLDGRLVAGAYRHNTAYRVRKRLMRCNGDAGQQPAHIQRMVR